jgi:hypothetical protein
MKKEAVSRNDWDFDNVPDNELVACCYWEFARESRQIRNLRQRCMQACREAGIADSLIPIVAGNIRHPNNSVEVFLREIVLLCGADLRESAAPPKPCGRPPHHVPSLNKKASLPGNRYLNMNSAGAHEFLKKT